MGELGRWFVAHAAGSTWTTASIAMQGWQPDRAPGYGWPLGERTWVNPSPNAPNLWMARCYAGTVMLEGTTLSEGRGTTRPLELFGAPDLDAAVRSWPRCSALAPHWLRGCRLRPCWFEPTFHKHVGPLCAGLQLHVEDGGYDHDGVPALARAGARVQGAAQAPAGLRRCGAISLTSTSATASPST